MRAVRYAKVKSPADVVIGTMRMAQDHTEPKPGLFFVAMEPKYMGMDLLNPPTVEGWHMGREWINSGSLIDRINFASKVLGDTTMPGVQSMVNRLMAQGENLTAEQMVDGCLDLVGPLTISDETRSGAGGPRGAGRRTPPCHRSGTGRLRPPRRRDLPDDRHHLGVPVRLDRDSYYRCQWSVAGTIEPC